MSFVSAACSSSDDAGGADATEPDPAVFAGPDEHEFFAPHVDVADRLLAVREPSEAFSVLVLALDRGYSAEQVERHVESLGPLGDIDGVDPAGEPIGMTDVVALPQGFAARPASGRSTVRSVSEPSAAEAAFVSALDLTLGDVHRRVAWETYREEVGAEIGRADPAAGSGTRRVSDATPEELLEVAMVVALAARGYGVDQIVEALVLGTIGADPPKSPCIVITDVVPMTGDGESFPCPPITLAKVEPATDDEPTDNAAEPETGKHTGVWEGSRQDVTSDDYADSDCGLDLTVTSSGDTYVMDYRNECDTLLIGEDCQMNTVFTGTLTSGAPDGSSDLVFIGDVDRVQTAACEYRGNEQDSSEFSFHGHFEGDVLVIDSLYDGVVLERVADGDGADTATAEDTGA